MLAVGAGAGSSALHRAESDAEGTAPGTAIYARVSGRGEATVVVLSGAGIHLRRSLRECVVARIVGVRA